MVITNSQQQRATGATNNGVAYPHASRVFSVWDIIGDHVSFSASLTAGNPATTPGTNGGYMAVINASYATSQAIQQTVAPLSIHLLRFQRLVPEYLPKRSCDSNGRGALNASYNGPYPPGVNRILPFS